MTKRAFTVFALLLITVVAFVGLQSQSFSGTTVVQQVPQMLQASTKVANANGAVNNQVTATATPSGSNYVYINGIDLAVCTNGTATAQSNVTFTSTNITGSPVWQYSTAATVNTCTFQKNIIFAQPLKSTTPGTAVTIVSPAAAAQNGYNINIYWYEAP